MFDFGGTETPGNRILNFLDTFHTIPSVYCIGVHNENLLKLFPTLTNTANLRYTVLHKPVTHSRLNWTV